MTILKTKTFIFNGYELGTYIRDTGNVDFDGTKIDRELNHFLKDHNVDDIKVATFSRGNNPPNAGVIYTVVYREDV